MVDVQQQRSYSVEWRFISLWVLNEENTQFHDLGPDYYDSRVNLNRKMRNHVRELQHLGYRVTLEPAA